MVTSIKENLGRKLLAACVERPVSRYYDAECGAVGRMYAQMVLRSNSHAREFLGGLKEVSQVVSRGCQYTGAPVDLWSRVEQGIRQERYNAVFERSRSQRSLKIFEFVPAQLRWAMSGAAVATGIAVLMVRTPGAVTGGEQVAVVRRGAEVVAHTMPVAQVRGGSGRAAGATLVGADRDAVELEWLRSKGAVRMIQVPDENSSIIWVKRQPRENQRQVAGQRQWNSQRGGDSYDNLMMMFSEDQSVSRDAGRSRSVAVPEAIAVGGR